jgi:hypothetical protein
MVPYPTAAMNNKVQAEVMMRPVGKMPSAVPGRKDTAAEEVAEATAGVVGLAKAPLTKWTSSVESLDSMSWPWGFCALRVISGVRFASASSLYTPKLAERSTYGLFRVQHTQSYLKTLNLG